MDLKLKITQKENANMSGLLKQMCGLKCRIKVDIKEGDLSITGMDDDSIEKVIDCIDETFNIVSIDIVPTIEVQEPIYTEESLEIAKIKFSDEEVENQANKLMKIISWAMYCKKATSRDICKFLLSTGTEINMKYNPNELIKFSIGDIVDCNFGQHITGEVSGGHVHSIVCDVDEDGRVYVVPISKEIIIGNPKRYLPFKANVDVDYIRSIYTGGTALIKTGRYIRPERIQSVEGSVRPEFFNTVLESLPQTVKFSHENYSKKLSERFGDVENDDSMLSFESSQEVFEKPSSGEEANENHTEKNSVDDVNNTHTEGTSNKVEEVTNEYMNEENTSINSSKPTAENYLASLLENSLNCFDKSKTVEDQIDYFLESIEFNTNEHIIKSAFSYACQARKIGYENIIAGLHYEYPEISQENIKSIMIDEFKKWIAKYPEAKEKYPKLSFMTLLKVFAKKMK